MTSTRERQEKKGEILSEMKRLREKCSINNSTLSLLTEKIRVEQLIEKGMTKVPQDIQEMPLHLLRTNLLNTAVAFKNEQVRNNLFEHKLEGAKA